jgi:MFS family permease
MVANPPAAAAGFVGLLSLFNMGGRFVWASISDYIGRRNTYMVFFVLGIILYSLVPTTGKIGSIPLFVGAFAIILSMYGAIQEIRGHEPPVVLCTVRSCLCRTATGTL